MNDRPVQECHERDEFLAFLQLVPALNRGAITWSCSADTGGSGQLNTFLRSLRNTRPYQCPHHAPQDAQAHICVGFLIADEDATSKRVCSLIASRPRRYVVATLSTARLRNDGREEFRDGRLGLDGLRWPSAQCTLTARSSYFHSTVRVNAA